MKLNCKSVSISEAGEEIFQVIFCADHDDHEGDDGPYLLLQRAFLEEDEEDEHDPCYVETHDVDLIGHYSNLDAKLTADQLILKLPSPVNETIDVNFKVSEKKYRKLKDMLPIILQ